VGGTRRVAGLEVEGVVYTKNVLGLRVGVIKGTLPLVRSLVKEPIGNGDRHMTLGQDIELRTL
jgi:hypothetical protein